MGLVLNGPDRMGEVIGFARLDGDVTEVKIVDPVFFDKDGEKQNV
jgi:sarcosine oxidase subunit alpha